MKIVDGGHRPRKRKLAIDIVLDEPLLCGGEWKTRGQLYRELIAEGFDPYYINYYLCCFSLNR